MQHVNEEEQHPGSRSYPLAPKAESNIEVIFEAIDVMSWLSNEAVPKPRVLMDFVFMAPTVCQR